MTAGTYKRSLVGVDEDGAVTSDLDLTGIVVIRGAFQYSTIMDAGEADPMAHVLSGAVVSIENITMTGRKVTGALVVGF